jgi:CubicO group peptidase (beta-lactamase class C family)
LLALLLAEEGKLDIDKPIRTYIGELTGPDGDPTSRLLMQHRGGSRCYLDLGFISHGMNSPPLGTALATQIRQTGRNFAPGEAMIYNNGGYHLLSVAIERVGGAPYETQVRERLFDPLGMRDTACVPSDYDITPGIATMHMPLPGGRWRRGLFPSEELRGEGSIVSTIDDMLRWMAHLRVRDRFGSAATWKALQAAPRYADGSIGSYALGLLLQPYRGLRTVHHSGGVMGGSSQMLTLPDHGLDVMIMANGAAGADPVKLAEQVVDIVLAAQVSNAAASIPAGDYAALLGDWQSPESGMIYTLVDEEGALKLAICKNPYAFALERTPDGRRVILRAGIVGEFELDLNVGNAPYRISVKFGGRSEPCQRVSQDAADWATFVGAVAGQYYCADAGTTATIVPVGDGMIMRMADGHGGVEVDLTWLGGGVAFAKPKSSYALFWCALDFIGRDGIMTGFRLNTMRTRHLEFHRSPAS